MDISAMSVCLLCPSFCLFAYWMAFDTKKKLTAATVMALSHTSILSLLC